MTVAGCAVTVAGCVAERAAVCALQCVLQSRCVTECGVCDAANKRNNILSMGVRMAYILA